jgi:HNH endonuclease
MPGRELTHARLCELLSYDPETGLWTWRLSRRGAVKAGAAAGSLNNPEGYLRIKIDGHLYLAHRLAVFYMTKSWPKVGTDHKDLDRINNRWTNLREATRSENQANIGAHRDNKLGVKGVSRLPSGKYGVWIMHRGKNKRLGTWDSAEMASWMYGVVSHALYGAFARAA